MEKTSPQAVARAWALVALVSAGVCLWLLLAVAGEVSGVQADLRSVRAQYDKDFAIFSRQMEARWEDTKKAVEATDAKIPKPIPERRKWTKPLWKR